MFIYPTASSGELTPTRIRSEIPIKEFAHSVGWKFSVESLFTYRSEIPIKEFAHFTGWKFSAESLFTYRSEIPIKEFRRGGDHKFHKEFVGFDAKSVKPPWRERSERRGGE